MNSLISQRSGIRLSQILPQAKFLGADEVLVQSCCGDWNDVEANDLYVAIVGADHDGHDFVHDALARGANAVVTERLLMIDRPQIVVPDSRIAYARICQALAGSPCQRMMTIGVSGSDGKTTTCHLIREILRQGGFQAGMCTSNEVDHGAQLHQHQQSPEHAMTAPYYADALSEMAINGCDAAILEFSSVELAQRTLDGIQFEIALLTNLRQANLDFHGTVENYRRMQKRILSRLKPDGMMIINVDDPGSHFLLEKEDLPALTIGMKQEAHVQGKLIEQYSSGQTFSISAGSDTVIVSSHIIGKQHIYNCLAAAAVGLAAGLDLTVIGEALSRVKRIPGRLERVECGQPFAVWIDSANQPTALATAINAIKKVTRGKLWCVSSTHATQSEAERRQIGEIAERAADRLVLTRDHSGCEIDYEPLHQTLDGCQSQADVRLIPNRFRAIEWTLSQAGPEDAVLICGCGEKPIAIVGTENWKITDRDVCEAWLYDQSSLAPVKNVAESNGSKDSPNIYNIDDYR